MKSLFLLLFLFTFSCSQKQGLPTLHNYPYFNNMDCPQEFSIEHEDKLRAEAKALNMRYVDYLHQRNFRKREGTLVVDR